MTNVSEGKQEMAAVPLPDKTPWFDFLPSQVALEILRYATAGNDAAFMAVLGVCRGWRQAAPRLATHTAVIAAVDNLNLAALQCLLGHLDAWPAPTGLARKRLAKKWPMNCVSDANGDRFAPAAAFHDAVDEIEAWVPGMHDAHAAVRLQTNDTKSPILTRIFITSKCLAYLYLWGVSKGYKTPRDSMLYGEGMYSL